MKKGFTLVELLAVVVLLAGIIALIYPTVLERIKGEEGEILEHKKKIVYTAAYDYLYENKVMYPIRSGKVYCVNMGYMAYNGMFSVDNYRDLLKIDDVYRNYVMVKIGDKNNIYKIVTNTSSCTDGVIGNTVE